MRTRRRHPSRKVATRARSLYAAAAALGCVALLAAAPGCAKQAGSSGRPRHDWSAVAVTMTPEQVRSSLMGFADAHSSRLTQAFDQLAYAAANDNDDPSGQVRSWAMHFKAASAMSTMTIASGPNPVIGLLDMVVMVTLRRHAQEEYWNPKLLGDRGKPLLAAYQQSEKEVWALAGRVLDARQLQELRGMIDEWRRDNPGQVYVGFVRFEDFDAYRQTALKSGGGAAGVKPGSLFSLLYVDPLAGLDPVADELRNYRVLTERLTYVAMRAPAVLSWQMQAAVLDSSRTPAVERFVSSAERFVGSSERFASATERFAKTTQQYPQDLTRERTAAVVQLGEVFRAERQAAVEQVARATAIERDAAIKQVSDAVTAQRNGIVKDLEAQESRIGRILADARGTVDAAQRTATTVTSGASGVLDSSEQATRRVLDHAFALAMAVVLTCLLGVPVVALAYRVAAARVCGPRNHASPNGKERAPCLAGPLRAESRSDS